MAEIPPGARRNSLHSEGRGVVSQAVHGELQMVGPGSQSSGLQVENVAAQGWGLTWRASYEVSDLMQVEDFR